MTKVIIGIQARSTSTRLPNKSLTILHNKPVLQWVINACMDSATFINAKHPIDVEVVVLCPYKDKIAVSLERQIDIMEGDEFDVLSRYFDAAVEYEADYIVRITGDCPFHSSFVITNHILKAVNHGYDYISNVEEGIRTELDGRDIEVMSRRALQYLNDTSSHPEEREHVTLRIREMKPEFLLRAHVLNRLDLSDVKLSVDTQEDLENAEKRMRSFAKKKRLAEIDVGKENVFYV